MHACDTDPDDHITYDAPAHEGLWVEHLRLDLTAVAQSAQLAYAVLLARPRPLTPGSDEDAAITTTISLWEQLTGIEGTDARDLADLVCEERTQVVGRVEP